MGRVATGGALLLGLALIVGLDRRLRSDEASEDEESTEPAVVRTTSPPPAEPVEPVPDLAIRYDHGAHYNDVETQRPPVRPAEPISDWSTARTNADAAWRERAVAAMGHAADEVAPGQREALVRVAERYVDTIVTARRDLEAGTLDRVDFRDALAEARRVAQRDLRAEVDEVTADEIFAALRGASQSVAEP